MLKNGNIYQCSIRSNVKKNRVVVGEYVEIVPNEYSIGEYIITRVFPRKNSIPRPPLANIDKLLILVSPKPEPDLLLVDKLIVYCMINNIEPVIIINKSDIASNDFINDIKSQYYFLKSFIVSATSSVGIEDVVEYIKGSLSAVCGQSAVGKSSLLNAIIPNINLDTQGLSRKVDRGKHTTRANEIYVYNDIMLADTPGFSNLELDLDHKELHLFYPEFDELIDKCRYINCSHVGEGKDCAIITSVDKRLINKDRYNRYKDLYITLKEKWENKYD